MRRIKTIATPNDPGMKGIKKERKELIKGTKDRILNIKRANENGGKGCIVCGNEIKKNQPFRELPKDRNCQEVRHYHLRTCGPGSDHWKAFRANGKKSPRGTFQWQQLSFKWKEMKG